MCCDSGSDARPLPRPIATPPQKCSVVPPELPCDWSTLFLCWSSNKDHSFPGLSLSLPLSTLASPGSPPALSSQVGNAWAELLPGARCETVMGSCILKSGHCSLHQLITILGKPIPGPHIPFHHQSFPWENAAMVMLVEGAAVTQCFLHTGSCEHVGEENSSMPARNHILPLLSVFFLFKS